MRENRVKAIWAADRAVLNGWCAIPSSFAAELMAHLGWDSLVIDTQHGLIDYAAMVAMLQGISTTAVTPLVRVPWNDPAAIMKALDAGAYGIICPMVNSRADCESFVGACRYAPRGYRSSGPTARHALWRPRLHHQGQRHDRRPGDDRDARGARQPRRDRRRRRSSTRVYIGPSDLSVSLGLPHGLDRSEDIVHAALRTVLDGCRRHRIKAGIHTGSTGYAKRMIEMGFDFVTVLSDLRLITLAGAPGAAGDARSDAASALRG